MPGREGVRQSSGERLLDMQAPLKDTYLALIRSGMGRYDAAESMGVNYSTVRRYWLANPDFLKEIEEAEANSVESVHRFYRTVMEDDSQKTTDRLNAADKLERALGRTQKTESVTEVKHTVEIGGNMVEHVLAMQRRLELEEATLDVESEEL